MPNNPQGQLDASRWIQEGDGLLASARAIRAQWVIDRRGIRKNAAKTHNLSSLQWSKLAGFPRASVLLLGYSSEMYLKAALAKVYRDCRPEMFDRDLKRFGHDYRRLSIAIDLPILAGDEELLESLKHFVTNSSRYPIFPGEIVDTAVNRFAKINEVTSTIWNRSHFLRLHGITKRIREHATRIDQDSQDPCSYSGYMEFGTNGYLCARSGGRVSSRITFRYSDEMRSRQQGLEDVKTLFTSDRFSLAGRIWDRCTMIEDGKQSIVIRGPKEAVPAQSRS